MSSTRAAITGVHGWIPKDTLTNADLEKMVDTSDEWITTRTGVKKRHLLKSDEGSSVIGVNAVAGLLEKTNTSPETIDLIIFATITPDYSLPENATIVAHKVGAVNAAAYDMRAACSGFLFALSAGSNAIESGNYKKVVVIGADKMSSIVDYKDRTTCVIFGDGGGAVLLEPNTEGYGIKDVIMKTDGTGADFLYLKGGGSKYPSRTIPPDSPDHFVHQEGSVVFKRAVNSMAQVSVEIMKKNNLSTNDLAYLVPHQANKRIIQAIANSLKLNEDKIMINIENYGNTTAGTLPLCLYDYEKKLKKGDNLILAAFGGGFSWGSIWLKWAY